MANDKKTCFIIMPITTPESVLGRYRDGADHFRHVLDCLLLPSVEMAGYRAVPPAAKGSDLIHAEVIKNLEAPELVLCDMSSLNPNVFFEFGIRTSLNKPVCVIKDDMTGAVPFDTAILNHQTYRASLEPWELPGEISKLEDHLRSSEERSKGQNALWKYFGVRSEARPYQGETGIDVKIEYLSMQIGSLRQELANMAPSPRQPQMPGTRDQVVHAVENVLISTNLPDGFQPVHLYWSDLGCVVLEYNGSLSFEERERLQRLVAQRCIAYLRFVRLHDPVSAGSQPAAAPDTPQGGGG